MAKLSIFTLLLALTSALAFLAASTEIILSSWITARIIHYRHRVYDVGYHNLDYVPNTPTVLKTLAYFEIAAGVVGLFAAVLAIIASALLFFRRSKSTAFFSTIMSVVVVIAAVVDVALLGWVFSQTNNGSGHLGYNSAGRVSGGWRNGFAYEKYACDVHPLVADVPNVGSWFKTSCDLARGARWTMVPLTVLLFITAVLSLFAGVMQVRYVRQLRSSQFEKRGTSPESRQS